MRLARRQEIRDIDRLATERYGISSTELIENAGMAMAREILSDDGWDRARTALIVCGPGNNGADGRVIARRLREAGIGVRILEVSEKSVPPVAVEGVGLIVDAIFGVGLSRPIAGPLRGLIAILNRASAWRVAVDVPSGLDADRGVILGACFKAHRTLTCGLAKPGFFLQDGPAFCGRIKVLKVGFPTELERERADSCFLVRPKEAFHLRPVVPATANKTRFGRVLVIGGAPGMEGAAVLAANAAARAGAGYVTLCTPGRIPFDRRPADFLSLAWNRLPGEDLSRYQTVVIGPGLGTSPDRQGVLEKVLEARLKTVIDADALTLVAKSRHLALHGECVLTPHAGELSRLIPLTAQAIEESRLDAAREAALEYGALVLLKGFRTVVSDGVRCWIIGSGNAALAKAGSGDVLTGFIAGWAAQGLALREASVLAASLHGEIADRWVREGNGKRSLMASDLPRLLARVLRRFPE